jgi:predicted ATP-binding protein involved in virulence
MQEKKPEQVRRIKQISVSNLFGMFDHTIPLNLDERITIIHGPSGFGKTVILRLLNELFSPNTAAIQATPFSEFHVLFEDGAELWVDKTTKLVDEDAAEGKVSLWETGSFQKVMFHLLDDKRKRSAVLPPPALLLRSSRSLWEKVIKNREPLMMEQLDVTYERALEIASVLRESLPRLVNEERLSDKENAWLREIRCSVPIRFIETQRLLNQAKSVESSGKQQTIMVPTVTAYSQELTEIIKTKLTESTVLSQSLDRTFPARLVSPTIHQRSITEAMLRHKLEELETKRTYLMAAGLIDQGNADAIQVRVSDQIDESTKAVLSVYVEDAEKKLGVFDEIANKIDLLKRIINERFLYKEMTISRNDGFVFTNANGATLSPTDLSSGEQHQLVLFYELLFKAAQGSLVLIDEPEISLHVVWQEQFLRDVQEVTRLNNINVLVATHSPDVIGGFGDLSVELKEPGSGRLPQIR